jgi:hypothetical protein
MFQTTLIRIPGFGFSGFGIYFGPGLFRSAGPLSIFGFRIFCLLRPFDFAQDMLRAR